MPAGGWLKRKLAVKLEKAGWWLEPPILRRERLHVASLVVLLASGRIAVAVPTRASFPIYQHTTRASRPEVLNGLGGRVGHSMMASRDACHLPDASLFR